MYRLIIVDDEEEIREGLSDLIDWADLGFIVTEKLQDGADAIRYLQEHHVDAILTDIKMTYTSGIDLAQYVLEHKLPGKVVILSGYQEFALAREAIRYNVSHYLLKPTDLSEVSTVFRKIKDELDRETMAREQIYKQNQHVKTLRPLLMEQFFFNLLIGGGKLPDVRELSERIQQLELTAASSEGKCCMMSVEWSGTPGVQNQGTTENRRSISLAITKESEQVHYTCVHTADNRFLIIGNALTSITAEVFQKKAEQYFLQIQSALSSLLGLSIRLEQLQLHADLQALLEEHQSMASAAVSDCEGADNPPETAGDERIIIREAKRFIDDHIETDRTLGDVASHVGLNPVYFSRLFKQETGQTYSDYCTKIRMRKAMDYLKDPKYKIYEIGFLVGYKNTKYFHKLFKRQMGVTPTEYRNQL